MPPKMPTVLGKRTRSNSNSTVASDCSFVSTSTSAMTTPNKRQRIKGTEDEPEDTPGSNKENIPPIVVPDVPQLPAVTRRSARNSTQPTPISAITPARRRQLTRAESTPVIELGNLQLSTPPATPSKSENNVNPLAIAFYSQARALLRTSSVTTIPFNGRESERAIIAEFLAGKGEGDESCLYISGTPGTGKTALVTDILKGMEEVQNRYVNCVGMRAEDIKAVARQTRDDHKEDEKAMVMVLDELEHLDGEVIPLLMAVATPTFRIVGISNTHTLTTKPTTSTLTLHFKPYTAQEMTDIISKRLATLSLPEETKAIVAPQALSFACRKIAAQTGDLRAALSLVRSAIELAEKEHIKKVFAHKGEGSVPLTPTAMSHVMAASKSATTQAPGTVSVVRVLNLQARLVLLALILATRRLSAALSLSGAAAPQTPVKGKGAKDAIKGKGKAVESLSTDALFNFYSRLLNGADAAFHAVSRSEFADLLGMLETQGLLELGAIAAGAKGKKNDKAQTVAVPSTSREEEMVKGLTVTEEGQVEGPTEREIRTMWTRETTKIKREVEDREMLFKKRKAAFEDAEEA
ncbi:hypothetical protein M408DRAFT_329185 [Serendipita vermifera MAFF 305830]|uniref:AAA+ ATPase domain-containing protein n=1 Tax=Serendipita vermifera MAFF 305830 TaxID=933852 RepID=A0A0C3AW21_SERVB|nr:hypothetical protein M408DRAFT_329185 [Serendipita vermifera MAFF 305830]